MAVVKSGPSAMAETWADRRSSSRRQPAVGTVYRMEPSKDREPVVGLVWNISASGLSMLLSDSREPGDVLDGRLTTGNDSQDVPIQVQIAHVRRLDTGDFFVGGQFEHRLTDDQVRPFLS